MAEKWIDSYALPGLATMAGIHQVAQFTKAVGKARGKHGVKVPETDGPPEFVRTFRAHQNTLEFYPWTLASLWVGSAFFHPVPASVAYMGYLYGRQKYFNGYIEKAENRTAGFGLSIKFLKALLFMAVIGAGHKAVRHYGNVDLWELISQYIPALSN